MKYKIILQKKKLIKQAKQQILLKYFSIKSGNDNNNLDNEINKLISKLKDAGLKVNQISK